MKIINYLLVLSILLAFSSCNEDDVAAPFDHVAQAIKDKEILKTFLESHYYTPPTTGENFGVVDTIKNGETSLMSLVTPKEVGFGDINYTIYYLKNAIEGTGESPKKVDSALVNYKGLLLTKINDDHSKRTVFDKNESYTFWANLYGKVIPGWTEALPNFKEGEIIINEEEPLNFENTGKGIIFIPSGLAYREGVTASIPSSSCLMFHVEMAMIKRNDQDRDGIKSVFEDLDNDDLFTDHDTDNDEKPNFVDFDDDGDGLSTKHENADPDGDGNPMDAIDTNTDGTPDYLDDDDDGDGILTENENADPDGDGDPSDAKDTDGDNTPDYLDNN